MPKRTRDNHKKSDPKWNRRPAKNPRGGKAKGRGDGRRKAKNRAAQKRKIGPSIGPEIGHKIGKLKTDIFSYFFALLLSGYAGNTSIGLI